jgi:hypothetical protein
MKVVNIRAKVLQKNGYPGKNPLVRWKEDPIHLYIGRFEHYVEGAEKSKWHNPYPVQKYGREEALRLYEEYVRNTPELWDGLEELKGKILGCWCAPEECHGDILIRLLKEKRSVAYKIVFIDVLFLD